MSIASLCHRGVMFIVLSCISLNSVYAGINSARENTVAKDQYIIVFKEKEFSPGVRVNGFGESVRQVAGRLISEARQNQVVIDAKKGIHLTDDVSKSKNKLGFVYDKALKGFSATLTKGAVARLKNNPLVEYIEQDYVITVDAIQAPTPTWGIDRIDQRELPLSQSYQYNTDGSNVHVYILDTGVRQSHSEFAGRIGNGYDFIDNDFDANDCHGHGTHVAGTASGANYGVAKNSIVHPLRVFDCSGNGSYSHVIAAIDWVSENLVSPAVVNMSLSGPFFSPVNTAVNNGISKGISFVVAAGNDYAGDACGLSPASNSNAITVASSDSLDRRSSFSNIGTCVDLIAPGSSILSAWNTNDTATNTASGTSMAAPHVAGVVALYLENNISASPAQVASAVITNSSPNKISDAGAGTPNRLLFNQISGSLPPPSPPSQENLAWLIPVLDLILN